MARTKKRPTAGWKPGFRPSVSARTAHAALETIRRAAGAITPAAVVAAARRPSHPLHKCFEWDDSEAAEKWRHQQARTLIHSVRVIYAEADGPALGYVSVRVGGSENERAYLPTSVVMSDGDYRDQALSDALRYLQGFAARHRHLEELADVFAAIDRVAARKGKRQLA